MVEEIFILWILHGDDEREKVVIHCGHVYKAFHGTSHFTDRHLPASLQRFTDLDDRRARGIVSVYSAPGFALEIVDIEPGSTPGLDWVKDNRLLKLAGHPLIQGPALTGV